MAYQVCPECDGDGCWKCEERGIVEPYDPFDTTFNLPDVQAVCPRCGGDAELRLNDGARWCDTCQRVFYTAEWPDPDVGE